MKTTILSILCLKKHTKKINRTTAIYEFIHINLYYEDHSLIHIKDFMVAYIFFSFHNIFFRHLDLNSLKPEQHNKIANSFQNIQFNRAEKTTYLVGQL